MHKLKILTCLLETALNNLFGVACTIQFFLLNLMQVVILTKAAAGAVACMRHLRHLEAIAVNISQTRINGCVCSICVHII